MTGGGPVEPMSWDELRAGCPMVFCDGDQNAWPEPGGPRCYCEHRFGPVLARFDRGVTVLAGVPGLMATEEPGRVTLLAPVTGARAGCPCGADPDARGWLCRSCFPVLPPPRASGAGPAGLEERRERVASDTLAQARQKWLGGQAGLGEFLAAVDRADLPELNRLKGTPWRRPWWKRWWLRVLRAVAGPRRVM